MNVTGKKFLSFVGAMKIARNVPVSDRHVEWYSPIPAPSLRELLSAAKLRECPSLNGKSQNLLSCVGAMKIARQPHGFASTPMNGKP